MTWEERDPLILRFFPPQYNSIRQEHSVFRQLAVALCHHRPPRSLDQLCRGRVGCHKSLSLTRFIQAWLASRTIHSAFIGCPLIRQSPTWQGLIRDGAHSNAPGTNCWGPWQRLPKIQFEELRECYLNRCLHNYSYQVQTQHHEMNPADGKEMTSWSVIKSI